MKQSQDTFVGRDKRMDWEILLYRNLTENS